jgi:glutamate-1-semialdehyde 2,1-aminomutase
MNMIAPLPGFLEGLRDLCDDYGSVFIVDEVMTGFRVAMGGAQEIYGITPDITTFGKVIGAGMPVGAYGGKREIMQKIAPLGPVYQAGTLSGNPVAMAAGLANLKLIQQPWFFENLAARTRDLCQGLEACAKAAGVPLHTVAIGGMFGMFFTHEPHVHTFAQAQRCDIEAFKRFFHACLKRGVYFAPSAYEAGFTSSTHDESVIAETLRVAAEAFAEIA